MCACSTAIMPVPTIHNFLWRRGITRAFHSVSARTDSQTRFQSTTTRIDFFPLTRTSINERRNHMNSFKLTAVGNLARNPEFVAKNDTSYARFCLVGNDYAGKDEGGTAREVTTSLWFVAFGPLGEALARNARKGDQLIVEAHVRANNWTDKQGEKKYDHSFIVEGFRFGAPGKLKREELDGRREDESTRTAAAVLAVGEP